MQFFLARSFKQSYSTCYPVSKEPSWNRVWHQRDVSANWNWTKRSFVFWNSLATLRRRQRVRWIWVHQGSVREKFSTNGIPIRSSGKCTTSSNGLPASRWNSPEVNLYGRLYRRMTRCGEWRGGSRTKSPVTAIMAYCGMKARKWVSNSKEVISKIRERASRYRAGNRRRQSIYH